MAQSAEQKKATKRAYYEAHKEERRAYQKAYYEAHKEELLPKYKARRTAKAEQIAVVKKAYRESRKEEIAAYMKPYSQRRRLTRRLRIIEHLGGVCGRCGIDDWRVLQVDHVLGGGRQERLSSTSGDRYYDEIMESPPGKYQLLCANCHQIKHYEDGGR